MRRRGSIGNPTEAQEQEALFRWAAYNEHRYPELKLMFHVPNGGSRNAQEAHNLRLQGVKAGVPDIVLPVPRNGFGALFIELKRRKGGRVSDHQSSWLEALTKAGNLAVRCDGFEAARMTIIEYLGILQGGYRRGYDDVVDLAEGVDGAERGGDTVAHDRSDAREERHGGPRGGAV